MSIDTTQTNTEHNQSDRINIKMDTLRAKTCFQMHTMYNIKYEKGDCEFYI